MNGEIQTGMEQYMNRMEKIKPELNDMLTEQRGTHFQSRPCLSFSVSLFLFSISLLFLSFPLLSIIYFFFLTLSDYVI
jgi:hypothetical protein